MFSPPGIRATRCFSDVDVLTPVRVNFIHHTFSIARSFHICPTHRGVSSLTLSRFDWITRLEQSLNCRWVSDFSSTFSLKPCCFISFWYFLCSCEFGVAVTKITASFPSRLYYLDPFPIFSSSHSSFLQFFGPMQWSFSFLISFISRSICFEGRVDYVRSEFVAVPRVTPCYSWIKPSGLLGSVLFFGTPV